jgi:precorrin-6A/cobalt-precorrin-6A reductase
MRILLLGGSTEASALASALASDPRFEAILSLAGRTRQPRLQPVPVRTGGFGGVDGLASFLLENGIDLVIDATHPFASQMSGNAIKAGKITGTPLLAIERPAWVQRDGDNWIEAPTVASAVQAIGPDARNVFCAIGSLALANLECAPHHTYLIRVIDKPASPPKLPNITILQSTGPFTMEGDIQLFREHRIQVVMAKNSGGGATVSKIEAARALHLPIIMVARPLIPPRPTAATTEKALAWLRNHYDNSTLRGV